MSTNFNKAFAMAQRIVIQSGELRIELSQLNPSVFNRNIKGIETIQRMNLDEFENLGRHEMVTETIKTFGRVRSYTVACTNDEEHPGLIVRGKAVITSSFVVKSCADHVSVSLTNQISIVLFYGEHRAEMEVTTEVSHLLDTANRTKKDWVESAIYLDGDLEETHPIPATILLG